MTSGFLPFAENVRRSPPEIQPRLAALHSAPLVKDYKEAKPYRLPVEQCWPKMLMQLNMRHLKTVLIADIDGGYGCEEELLYDQNIPEPSWVTRNPHTGNCHVVWALKVPVWTGDKCRASPVHYFHRVGEALLRLVGSDPSYNQAFTRSPLYLPSQTIWSRETHQYTLAELAAYIPKGFRLAPARISDLVVVGRNDELFRSLRRWGGRPANWEASMDSSRTMQQAEELSQRLHASHAAGPLPAQEQGWIVSSCVGYAIRNIQSGRQQRTFKLIQSARGRASGAARRKRTAQRDARIWLGHLQGHSVRTIAAAEGISRNAVHHAIKRTRQDLAKS